MTFPINTKVFIERKHGLYVYKWEMKKLSDLTEEGRLKQWEKLSRNEHITAAFLE